MPDPSDLASGAQGSRTLIDDLFEHQTFLLIGLVVLAHIVGIGAVLFCMYQQQPKDVRLQKREFGKMD